MEKVLGNPRNGVLLTPKVENLSSRPLAADVQLRIFYKLAGVSIKLLEIFLATS
jgi:hypothetical protein